MVHGWSIQDGTHVLINANDGKTILAYVGKREGKFALAVVAGSIRQVDITAFNLPSMHDTLEDAKAAAEKEVKRRIARFSSPGV
jgi:hypothetical protein